MKEVVVVAAFVANPGKEDDALAAFKSLAAASHAEDGCILFALHRGSEDAKRLTFIERWESPESLDAHLSSDHVNALLERSDELWGENVEITVYHAVAAGEPTKGALATNGVPA